MPQSSLNLLEDSSTGSQDMRQKGTGGNAHVLLKNTAVTTQSFGDGGQVVTLAATTGVILSFGDISIYGYPYSSVDFTKGGANGTMTLTWGITSGGVAFVDVIMNALDTLDITAKNIKGDTIASNIVYKTSVGATTNAQITGAANAIIHLVGAD